MSTSVCSSLLSSIRFLLNYIKAFLYNIHLWFAKIASGPKIPLSWLWNQTVFLRRLKKGWISASEWSGPSWKGPGFLSFETFFITLVRHFNQPERRAAIDFFLPSDVLGPVDMPPWNLHLPPFSNSLHWQGKPFLFFAPQIFRSFFLPFRICY